MRIVKMEYTFCLSHLSAKLTVLSTKRCVRNSLSNLSRVYRIFTSSHSDRQTRVWISISLVRLSIFIQTVLCSTAYFNPNFF